MVGIPVFEIKFVVCMSKCGCELGLDVAVVDMHPVQCMHCI